MGFSPPDVGESTSLESFIFNFVDWFSEFSSLHGFCWVHRAKSRWAKTVITYFTNFVFYGTLAMLILDGIQFAADKSIESSEVSRPEVDLRYPQFMVCHPFYFKRENFLGMIAVKGPMGTIAKKLLSTMIFSPWNL